MTAEGHKHIPTILLLAGMILLWSGLFPTLVTSEGRHAIEIQANQAQVQFPDQITFQLDITTASPVDTIELEYGVDKIACGQTSGRVAPDIVERSQGRYAYAAWTWELRRSGSLPPGARIWWQWHITTEAGESKTTPRTWVTFDDDRYEWQTVTEGQITVYWYEGDQTFGQQMLQTAVQAQARLTADPDANLEKAVHIYFYANSDDLKAALIFPQRWTGGVAFTDFYTVLIAASPQNQSYGQRTVAHELMHLVVHQLAFNCWSPLPRWLDEGLACWAEGDLEPVQQETLDEAITQNKLLSLKSLNSSFSAHANRAHLSYAQSYSVVVFLIDEYGPEKILELLAVFRDGATYKGALGQVYGFDTEGLDDLWRASIGAQPRPTAVAPVVSPTPLPTLALWSGEPTPLPATATTTATSSPTAKPPATATPLPTQIAAIALPTAQATRTPSSSPTSVYVPTPIGGSVGKTGDADWIKYALGGSGILAGLLILALVIVYVRRR